MLKIFFRNKITFEAATATKEEYYTLCKRLKRRSPFRFVAVYSDNMHAIFRKSDIVLVTWE